MALHTSPGRPYPLGATVSADGINFAVFSRHGTQVFVELFDAPDARRPSASLQLDPARNRTGDIWHLFVRGPRDGQLYGYRVDGPHDPARGHRFNVNKLLFDPYARAFAGRIDADHDAVYGHDRRSARRDLSFSTLDSAAQVVRSVALAPQPFDWEDDRWPGIPLERSLLYELHVRGFTAHASSGVARPGTFLGVIDKIPHLAALGVTAVELMPVHEFAVDEPHGPDPVTGAPLGNFWGYSTLGFFAAQRRYASDDSDPRAALNELRQLVKALHRAGIEVILDVVYNHTGEGDHEGPTLGFRGLDNAAYYALRTDRRFYRNYSGCGNTLDCNQPLVKQLILDSLRYWVAEAHVDGFRFDLATILGRDDAGEWVSDGLLRDIEGDPILRRCKLIAEPWDAGGMCRVGGFPAAWADWNGRFRDDVRRFVRGDEGVVADFARRIGGSADLFGRKTSAAHSVNFVTAHDGFTLRDLVSYRRKHNQRNGEGNRDGPASSFSHNCGAEGPSRDPRVRRLRLQQGKNLLTALLLARGTPMLLGGDELWRTQQGNDNAYCQDNEISWVDWTATDETEELLRFVRRLVALRRRHPALRHSGFVDPLDTAGVAASGCRWHGVELDRPDWRHCSHSIAVQLAAPDGDLYAAFNAWTEPLTFELPSLLRPALAWYRVVDTARPSPDDIVDEARARPVDGPRVQVEPRSAVVLVARQAGSAGVLDGLG